LNQQHGNNSLTVYNHAARTWCQINVAAVVVHATGPMLQRAPTLCCWTYGGHF